MSPRKPSSVGAQEMILSVKCLPSKLEVVSLILSTAAEVGPGSACLQSQFCAGRNQEELKGQPVYWSQ